MVSNVLQERIPKRQPAVVQPHRSGAVTLADPDVLVVPVHMVEHLLVFKARIADLPRHRSPVRAGEAVNDAHRAVPQG